MSIKLTLLQTQVRDIQILKVQENQLVALAGSEGAKTTARLLFIEHAGEKS